MRGRASRNKLSMLLALSAMGGFLMNDCQIMVKDATVSGIKSYFSNDFLTTLIDSVVPGDENSTDEPG